MTLQERRFKIRTLQKELETLYRECPHIYGPSNDGDSPSAVCIGCGARFGWYCPKSPDHACDYSEPGNLDSCKYCGEPDERK